MFNVIVPSVFRELSDTFLASVFNNTLVPRKIILVNDSGDFWDQGEYPKNVYVINAPRKMGVNGAWNLGVALLDRTVPYSCIINDDVITERFFFEKIVSSFAVAEETGLGVCCVCPATTSDKEYFGAFSAANERLSVSVQRMRSREGWAMTFKTSVLIEIPRIPSGLKTFCGDDWYWKHTVKNKLFWFKSRNTLVYHAVGATVDKTGVRGELKREKRLFSEILK